MALVGEKKPNRLSLWLKSLVLAVLVGAVLVAALAVIYIKTPVTPAAIPTDIMYERGMSSRDLAQLLDDAGVVRCQPCFWAAMGWYRKATKATLKAGEYRFDAPLTPFQLLDRLARGDVIMRNITLPEGLSTRQMLDRIVAEPLLSGEVPATLPEGSLLPETYRFTRGDARSQLIATMQKNMDAALAEAWSQRDSSLPIQSPQQLLIMASLIERETGQPEERAKVAGVFYNRLNKGMMLQTDPTIIYALTSGSNMLGRDLTRDDLAIESPYNTYRVTGLPPTPIANPGKASLTAAARPEQHGLFYFVADGQGGHRFAATLEEHNQNVNLYRQWQRQQSD